MSHMFLFCRNLLFSGTHCPVFYINFSLALGLNSLLSLMFTIFSHQFILFLHSFSLFSLPLRLFPLFWYGFFSCFVILTVMLVCGWLRWVLWLHVPPTCRLASRLQWAALSGLWVWALPPQALPPLAGCTGAFHGQVPSTTCDPTPPPPENSWCSIFLLTCTIKRSASTNCRWLSVKWLLLGVKKCWQRKLKIISHLPLKG